MIVCASGMCPGHPRTENGLGGFLQRDRRTGRRRQAGRHTGRRGPVASRGVSDRAEP